MPNIPVPVFQDPITDESGMMTLEFQAWVRQITEADLMIGTGSPEGVIEANVGREYMDDAGVAGSIKYIKRDADIAGDKSQGWVLV